MSKKIYTIDGKKVDSTGIFTKVEGYLKNWKEIDSVSDFLKQMKTIMIAVDFSDNKIEEEKKLHSFCAQYYFYAQLTESVYLIKSMQATDEILKELKQSCPQAFVMKLGNGLGCAWTTIRCSNDWIHKYL